ncbi:hypothetical protein [Evansella cellulosilytica]|uniref:Uncharacterized protein n=1 Tax=Evansella cellulosilytica (strain ATCC 21833 / DSM 2522 / FERM P-1141 / JCM 9156 / N-4) TaxID=649639 RepID=E6TU67_EVAC2|nr:hypothetical protein [Evansella cellulosilytica]ADU28527.1 hypothetical protein Bcell_0240 [Evansella cellulosilytica DSM 2522]
MKRLLIKASIFSAAIHVIYLLWIVGYSWFVTRNYVPDIADAYENIAYLQNEVTFGFVIHPVYTILSFIIIAIIGALGIQFYDSFRLKRAQ